MPLPAFDIEQIPMPNLENRRAGESYLDTYELDTDGIARALRQLIC